MSRREIVIVMFFFSTGRTRATTETNEVKCSHHKRSLACCHDWDESGKNWDGTYSKWSL